MTTRPHPGVEVLESQAWAAVVEGVDRAVVVTDEALRVRFANAAAAALLGRAAERLRGEALAELLPGDYTVDPPPTPPGWRMQRLTDGWALYGAGEAEAERRLEAQQHAAIEQLATALAQELRPPLTAISVAVEYSLKNAERDSALARDLEMVLTQTERLARLARTLVDMARPAEPAMRRIDLGAVVAEGYALVERRLRRSGVEGGLELDAEAAPMLGDVNQLQQVVVDLVLHAQRAVLAEGAAEKRVAVRVRRQGGANELEVRDHGAGLDTAELARLLLPFHSRGDGPESGLYAARSIVHRHGGTLQARSEPGRGTTIVARFPERADGGEG
jgi:signal transduction histidine kinase